MTPDDLLEVVHDRESFIAFVQALAEQRRRAEKMEQENVDPHRLHGELGWENGDIASFLEAALYYFKPRPLDPPAAEPSWRMFAEFLYFGKIIE